MSVVDIAGRHYGGASSSSIDASNLLTVQKGNNLYVNEEGDKMHGPLDMSNNRIINVAEPTELRDGSTKFYVDDQIRTLSTRTNALINQRIVDESKSIIEKNRLPQDIVNKEFLDNTIKDERQSINIQFLDNGGLIRSDKLPPITYFQHFYIFNIGESPTVPFKLSKFQISLNYDRTTNLDFTPKYPKLTRQMIHLQITPLLNTDTYHDEIFMNIQRYDITHNGLDVYIITVRSNNLGWGLYLQAHLTLTINFNNISIINST